MGLPGQSLQAGPEDREHRLSSWPLFFFLLLFTVSRSSVRGDFSSPVMFSALLFQKPAKELTEVGICGLGL